MVDGEHNADPSLLLALLLLLLLLLLRLLLLLLRLLRLRLQARGCAPRHADRVERGARSFEG